MTGVGILVLGAFVLWHRSGQSKVYKPGTVSTGVTRELSHTAPSKAPSADFEDVTREAGLDEFRTFTGERSSQLPEDMGTGAAWGDYDLDGDQDLFLVAAGGRMGLPKSRWAPSRLYENQGDGTFEPVEGFPDVRCLGMAAAWGDYDMDGYPDLVITGYDTLLLFRNEGGTGSFQRDERFPQPEGYWSGVAWGDYNRDRAVDLYVCHYVDYTPPEAGPRAVTRQFGKAVPYTLNPASFDPGANLLFRNNRDGTFTEVAAEVGVANPTGRSLGAIWNDFNADGRPDLYVANDVSDNVFYRNEGGSFAEVGHAALVADYRGAMGLTAGDWDRDGDEDLFITHWTAQENALYENLLIDEGEKGPGGKADKLRFRDVADRLGLGQVALSAVGWGTEAVDFDHDGWLDLVVANGSTLETGTSPKRLEPQKPFLFWNQQGETFFDIAKESPVLSQPHVSRGLAVADYDNDGDQDVLMVHLREGVQLLRNDMATGRSVKIRLRSRNANERTKGFGVGARLTATMGGTKLVRDVTGGASYLSQSSRIVHLGVGQAKRLDRLVIDWVGDRRTVLHHLPVGCLWEVTEGQSVPRVKAYNRPPIPDRKKALAEEANQGDPKERQELFWKTLRRGVKAMQRRNAFGEAIHRFRRALSIRPSHETARYRLAQCLVAQGMTNAALAQLDRLVAVNPASHRALVEWGRLQALTGRSRQALESARGALKKARRLNPEETGGLLLLGEVNLLLGNWDKATTQLTSVCQEDPKAIGPRFLRAYLLWRTGRKDRSRELLKAAGDILANEKTADENDSEGATLVGQYHDWTPLARFWVGWQGGIKPKSVFSPLQRALKKYPAQP